MAIEPNLYFIILEHLAEKGIGEEANISHLFDKTHLCPREDDSGGQLISSNRSELMSEFLDIMKGNGHVTYCNYTLRYNYTEKWVRPVDIYARITASGISFLSSYKISRVSLKSMNTQRIISIIAICITSLTILSNIYLAFKNESLSSRLTKIERSQRVQTLSTKKPVGYNHKYPLKKKLPDSVRIK